MGSAEQTWLRNCSLTQEERARRFACLTWAAFRWSRFSFLSASSLINVLPCSRRVLPNVSVSCCIFCRDHTSPTYHWLFLTSRLQEWRKGVWLSSAAPSLCSPGLRSQRPRRRIPSEASSWWSPSSSDMHPAPRPHLHTRAELKRNNQTCTSQTRVMGEFDRGMHFASQYPFSHTFRKHGVDFWCNATPSN